MTQAAMAPPGTIRWQVAAPAVAAPTEKKHPASWISRGQDRGGDACIRNRIPVWLLVNRRRLGGSDAELLREYPSLTPDDLEIAWEYAAIHGEEIGRAIQEAKGIPVAQPTEQPFLDLVKQWKSGRGHTSSINKMVTHPAYQQIIAMGKQAIPLLLRELEREPDHWFWAMKELTGANPVPPESRAKVAEMAQHWVRWGKAQGLWW